MTTEGAYAQIDRHAGVYIGKDEYPLRKPEEERVIVKIAPEHIDATDIEE